MNPKELSFDQEGRDKLLNGITKISTAVKSTLGPLGKTVLIESPNHRGGITITKDGVTVAKSIDLEEPFYSSELYTDKLISYIKRSHIIVRENCYKICILSF